ncbi:cell envelope integrity EipB family protein [Microbaculum sp. FT89]|uniref:cell envelope integrity EipB family protein n=1 Tax=Microbaculum sp. FT89 TaxID=3447298 RepID=UPI003F53DC73
MLMPRLGRFAFAAALVLVATPLQAGVPTIAPHRAVYDLEIDRTQGGGGSSDIEGRLVLETMGSACEGFTVTTRFVTRITGTRRSLVNDLRSTTWEAGDGSSYRFVTKNYLDQDLADETDGIATREDGTITVDLSVPEDTEFSLDSEILFPTQHVMRILQAAESGEKIVVADIYDGSDTGRKVYSTTTVIGARREPGGDEGQIGDDVLGDLASWSVSVGYFDNDAENKDLPSYEFSYDLFSNGVSRKIVLDYGDFTLVGDLSAIEFLDAEPCEQ